MFLTLIGLCIAKPAELSEAEATVIEGSERLADYISPQGYDFMFKTSNNIERMEVADLDKNIVTGEYSYISPEGT